MARGSEVIPKSPAHYFNDYAQVVSAEDAQQLDDQLQKFEKDTTNQVVVAVYPKMQSDSDIADYTFRVKEAWKVGQKIKNNGIVLFVFISDRKMFIQVGYGLEGALPDATCKDIIDQQIAPRFKEKDYVGGLTAGINSILAATKGEYKSNNSNGNVPLGRHSSGHDSSGGWFFAIVALIFIISIIRAAVRGTGGTFYQPNRRPMSFWESAGLFLLSSAMNSGSSGGSSYSGGGSGGGGGFSGGGGTGGGGGAGGSW